MSVFVSGASGFVGKHVVRSLQKHGFAVTDKFYLADTLVHLAWEGLPNYESPEHYKNVEWQVQFLRRAVEQGINNITVAGTCLETLDILTPYAISKLAIRARAMELLPELKWARLWYLYGEGQKENCLLPALRKAKEAGAKEFGIIDGARDFMDVADAAQHITRIATQSQVTGIIDCCSGVAESVFSFCKRHVPGIKLRTDYPRPSYEPYSFHGDPTKLLKIL